MFCGEVKLCGEGCRCGGWGLGYRRWASLSRRSEKRRRLAESPLRSPSFTRRPTASAGNLSERERERERESAREDACQRCASKSV